MRYIFYCCAIAFGSLLQADGHGSLMGEKEIYLTIEDCLFVKCAVPKKGIVCSNQDRALRISQKLENTEMHRSSWGPFVVIGDYRGERIFVGCASVGTGSGLFFTELFVAGAEYLIRYGSDDIKAPPSSEAYLVKIIDEADNLYGFNMQSGVDPAEYGKAVPASAHLIETLIAAAQSKGLSYEVRICHHLENYHGLRSPHKFSLERRERLEAILEQLRQNPKPASYDMETAVLFRVAKDFGFHAATVLQTVNKERLDYQQAMEVERAIFFDYVLDALLEI